MWAQTLVLVSVKSGDTVLQMVNINRSITLRTNSYTSFLPTLDDYDIYDLCRHI